MEDRGMIPAGESDCPTVDLPTVDTEDTVCGGAPDGQRFLRRTRGAIAYVIKAICVICGHRTSYRAEYGQEQLDSSDCPHLNLSHCKSTVTLKRFVCHDCQIAFDVKTAKSTKQL